MGMTSSRRAGTLLLAILALAATAATASAAQVEMKYLDKPWGPQALPGDNLPPFGMLD